MKIYLHEITDHDTDLDFTQDEKWVVDAVLRVDEGTDEKDFSSRLASAGKPQPKATPKPRPIAIHLNLRKVDDVVVVSGKISTHIELICSRCANPFELPCSPTFSALFCNDPVMAGVGHLDEPGKPAGQNRGFARHAHDTDETKDLDITYLSEDFIDLSAVLTEQLQFQVPFQPLCREDCKGICTSCGADLNAGRCACAKIAAVTPFSVLRDLKI